MKLPDSGWRKRGGLPALLDALDARNGKTRFVGGCVRDTLLDLPVNDIDLATALRPDAVVARLTKAKIKAVPTGIAHGTITAVLAGKPVEVTTLRRDVSTDGRRATVAFTDDWREDAARRDFTINALTSDPISGEIFDYFGGLEDLAARRVRFIGDPRMRIAEDHLRILRFFRFHARFGAGEADPDGLRACAERANDLMALSRERIADELMKLLALDDPTATVNLMVEQGIFRPVLPEIESSERLDGLIAAERSAGIAPEAVRRLAALLPKDKEVAASVAARLRLSRRTAARLVSAADSSLADPRPLAYRIGISEAIDRFLLHDPSPPDLSELQAWQRPRLPIGGGDLIRMGLSAGPMVARTLQAVEREWVESGFADDREQLRAIARRHVDQALRESQ